MRDTSRIRGHLVRAVAAGALAIGTIGIGAMPAPAADLGSCAITGNNNGYVGVPQNLSVVDCVGAGYVTVTYANGTTSPQQLQIYPGPGDNGIATWTPSGSGTANLALGGTTYATSVLSQVPTSTQVSTPNTASLNQPTKILVIVKTPSPSAYAPTGTVTVTNANGAPLQTLGLTPGPGQGQSYAYYWWTPTQSGTYYFVATYNGDANAKHSTSTLDSIIATPSGGTISISAPATMTQGVPVTLTATVFPRNTQGSVGFTINGGPISASIPLVNGQASYLWTPNVVGNVTLGASYTTNQGGSGSTSEPITVVAGPVSKDVITLSQPGVGIWGPNASFQVQNGTTFTFQASTLSGAGVTLTETGPCQVSGLTLVVDTGNGQCNLTASSPGGDGYAAVQQGYTVITIPGTQTAALAAPNSGRVNKGKTLTLEKASQGTTNAGQNITWKITKGKKICKLTFPKNGSVKLKINKKGYCNVKASAPGVAYQWNPFTLTRSYQGV